MEPENAPSPEESVTLESSLESALADREPETQEPSQIPTPASEPEKAEPAEPDHVKWAKSVEGNFDKATGQLNSDRLAKQAFELHKQSQTTAQQIAQLNQLLRHPEIIGAIQKVLGGPAAGAKPDEKEKTDEQILDEFVNERVKKQVEPLLPLTHMMYQNYIQGQMEVAYQKLKEEFGRTEDDSAYVYDTIRSDVVRQIADAAARTGTNFDTLLVALVNQGILYDTFASAARNALYPKFREAAVKAKTSSEDKKKARLTPKGTSVSRAKEPEKPIRSFMDAVEAAEKELAQ